MQYLWKSGYNPEGFVQFFDRMASKEGYVEKTSFFRTHPAFYDRIVTAYREISFLPQEEQAVDNTSEFRSVKAHLQEIAKSLDAEEEEPADASEARERLRRTQPGDGGPPVRALVRGVGAGSGRYLRIGTAAAAKTSRSSTNAASSGVT